MLGTRDDMENTSRQGTTLRLAVMACLALGACATDLDTQGDGEESSEEPEQLAALAVPKVEVTASGSGCPAGSFQATVSEDGENVDISFRSYGGTVSSRAPTLSESCTLSLEIKGQQGVSYHPQAVSVSGKNNQASGSYASSVYWAATPDERSELGRPAGAPLVGWEASTTMRGLVSPCGGDAQELRIESKMDAKLESTSGWSPRGEFTVNALKVKLKAAACGEQAPEEGGSLTLPPNPEPLPASGVTIRSVKAFGSGCPSGTSRAVLSPDGQNFTVQIEGFSVTAGQGNSAPYCNVTLDAVGPDGQVIALESYVVRGKADLAAGVTGEISGLARFTGIGGSLANTQYTKVAGPLQGAFGFERTIPAGDLAFSECGRSPGAQLSLRPVLLKDAAGALPTRGSIAITEIGPIKFALRSCAPNTAP